jgi:hypothetical protein
LTIFVLEAAIIEKGGLEMFTLKIITTDIDGEQETHLFYGTSISHLERESNNYQIKFDFETIGSLIDKTSEQRFLFSQVLIYVDGDAYSKRMYILPHADCYVMENGKTVDQFSCKFIQ